VGIFFLGNHWKEILFPHIFDKLLEANTVGVSDAVSLLQVLLGILLNSTLFLRVMFLLECTFLLLLYVFSPVTHTSPTYEGSRKR
jgi:hypothetical protein